MLVGVTTPGMPLTLTVTLTWVTWNVTSILSYPKWAPLLEDEIHGFQTQPHPTFLKTWKKVFVPQSSTAESSSCPLYSSSTPPFSTWGSWVNSTLEISFPSPELHKRDLQPTVEVRLDEPKLTLNSTPTPTKLKVKTLPKSKLNYPEMASFLFIVMQEEWAEAFEKRHGPGGGGKITEGHHGLISMIRTLYLYPPLTPPPRPPSIHNSTNPFSRFIRHVFRNKASLPPLSVDLHDPAQVN